MHKSPESAQWQRLYALINEYTSIDVFRRRMKKHIRSVFKKPPAPDPEIIRDAFVMVVRFFGASEVAKLVTKRTNNDVHPMAYQVVGAKKPPPKSAPEALKQYQLCCEITAAFDIRVTLKRGGWDALRHHKHPFQRIKTLAHDVWVEHWREQPKQYGERYREGDDAIYANPTEQYDDYSDVQADTYHNGGLTYNHSRPILDEEAEQAREHLSPELAESLKCITDRYLLTRESLQPGSPDGFTHVKAIEHIQATLGYTETHARWCWNQLRDIFRGEQ